MSNTLENLKNEIAAGNNVLLAGEIGTGVVASVRTAVVESRLKSKHYDCATLVIADELLFHAQLEKSLRDVDVVVFENADLSRPAVLDVIIESLQFGSFGGIEPKNLKSVVLTTHAAENLPVGFDSTGVKHLAHTV